MEDTEENELITEASLVELCASVLVVASVTINDMTVGEVKRLIDYVGERCTASERGVVAKAIGKLWRSINTVEGGK